MHACVTQAHAVFTAISSWALMKLKKDEHFLELRRLLMVIYIIYTMC